MIRGRNIVPLALAGLIALALALAGCSIDWSPSRITAPAPTAPAASTPVGAVQRFIWANVHRSPEVYRALFTDDFVFRFADLDPAGAPYAGRPWVRDDELAYAQHLFLSSNGSQEVASEIALTVLNVLTDRAERAWYGDSTRHRVVDLEYALEIRYASGSLPMRGTEQLHLVRGDVAMIPADLLASPDSTRWYIVRWDDLGYTMRTPPAPSRATGPAATLADLSTWGSVKALYR